MTPFYIHKIEGNQAWLDGKEARHCTKVMRKKAGDTIIAIDGKGFMHVSRIKTMGKNALELEILESHENWGEKSQRVVLCISPLHKVDRLEWLIEKGVELGVTDFILYIGKHTVKTGFRLDRLERIMAAALKQSLLEHVISLRDDGMTVLFVEHDMDMVQEISDWVVVMAEGRIIAEGPPASIGQNQAVVDAYLGSHHDAPLDLGEA